MSLPVLLTVRGSLVPPTLEAARVLHNETAGSPPGIAAARALGDLSHKVYAPHGGADSGTARNELLFIDVWCDAQGIGQFFSNHEVQQQANRLFSAKDASIWMPAHGSFSYTLPAMRAAGPRYVGMVRGPVASPETAIKVFADADAKAVRDARRRGILAHQLFVRINLPGDNSPPQLLGLDLWGSESGMEEHYADATHMAPLAKAFSAQPAASVWQEAVGEWSEW